jgi:hypothetical protein
LRYERGEVVVGGRRGIRTIEEWEAFLDDFRQTLDKFKVPAEEQAELNAIVNSTRSDIVVDAAVAACSNS